MLILIGHLFVILVNILGLNLKRLVRFVADVVQLRELFKWDLWLCKQLDLVLIAMGKENEYLKNVVNVMEQDNIFHYLYRLLLGHP